MHHASCMINSVSIASLQTSISFSTVQKKKLVRAAHIQSGKATLTTIPIGSNLFNLQHRVKKAPKTPPVLPVISSPHHSLTRVLGSCHSVGIRFVIYSCCTNEPCSCDFIVSESVKNLMRHPHTTADRTIAPSIVVSASISTRTHPFPNIAASLELSTLSELIYCCPTLT